MDNNISFYSSNAVSLIEQYDNIDFSSVHQDWLNEIPSKGLALDIGAGSGRDARFLAAKGLDVVAVEPSDAMRDLAQKNQSDNTIHWLSDSLPDLKQTCALQTKFDLILLSAVWMHIAPSLRNRCIRKLSSLLKPSGKLIISLRHGPSPDERVMHPVSASELSTLASQYGLTYKLLSEQKQDDQLGRDDVTWQTVMLTLPDDGTGAFPLIRNIVVNDSKSSTYKVALLRTLLRIAEGHPGAVIEQTDEHVVLPMGLVALYWMKLYKPLIDQYDMQQNSSNSKGLGFIKSNGWEQLTSHTANDFYIGAAYRDIELAEQLYKTLKDISRLIKSMPATYTKLPNSKDTVFQVELSRTSKPEGVLVLDSAFLSSLGEFYVPRHIWDSLTRFSVWIEPVLVNEWATLMAGYGLNKEKAYTKLDYLNALNWEDPTRTTSRVRKRVDELLSQEKVVCCWSGSDIVKSSYAVDHAFPFARWPNNDLWNLLPSKSCINANKSDKLPTGNKLRTSSEFIKHWWRQAWHQNLDEFFAQANFALPNLSQDNRSIEDVFDAFMLQRDRIKDFQQLEDWGAV